jgi:hypothetical protein
MKKIYVGIVREDKMVAKNSRWFVMASGSLHIVDEPNAFSIMSQHGEKGKDYELINIDRGTVRNLIEMEFGTLTEHNLTLVK